MLQETAGLGAFIAKRRLWMSRRALRKKWSGVLGSEEQFPLLVEALVRVVPYSKVHISFVGHRGKTEAIDIDPSS